MEVIQKREIDFKRLIKLRNDNSYNKIFIDRLNKKIYKIFTIRSFIELNDFYFVEKELKVRALSDVNIEGLVVADMIIMDHNRFCGIAMPYIEGTMQAFDYCGNGNLFDILRIFYKISQVLRRIHEQEIVVCDVNLANILVDSEENIYFIDSDSYSFYGHPGEALSELFDIYCKEHRLYIREALPKYDKFQLFLLLMATIFGDFIDDISETEYDNLSKMIPSLKNMQEYFLAARKGIFVPDIPYLDELISEKNITYTLKK